MTVQTLNGSNRINLPQKVNHITGTMHSYHWKRKQTIHHALYLLMNRPATPISRQSWWMQGTVFIVANSSHSQPMRSEAYSWSFTSCRACCLHNKSKWSLFLKQQIQLMLVICASVYFDGAHQSGTKKVFIWEASTNVSMAFLWPEVINLYKNGMNNIADQLQGTNWLDFWRGKVSGGGLFGYGECRCGL